MHFSNRTKILWAFAALLLALIITFYAVPLAILSPAHIRDPQVAHHHFRLQILVNGNAVDFTTNEIQEPSGSGFCDGELTQTPIHFHDQNGQMVHIHWGKIRGGDVLKYYGANTLGGGSELGWRLDLQKNWLPQPVKNHSSMLGEIEGKTVWIFAQNQTDETWKLRNNDEFFTQDLETFFGTKSSLTIQQEELKNQSSWLVLNAAANYLDHDKTNQKMDVENKTQRTQDEIKKLQNVLGDVVIFVQNTQPTEAQIASQFETFQPIVDSICGG